ncbi:MAG: site-specific DNA-methyltransferase [Desulfobacterales bacterium]|nr:site-specific DNA-methyltransferase [Desulfobacterales bacterium]
MKTVHRIFFQNAKKMAALSNESVALMVTSPPYPMIAMWDELFVQMDRSIKKALRDGEAMTAFELIHHCLDPVWREVYRVLVPGGIACINIGDATRTIAGNFGLYPNHARILSALVTIGFSPLPEILWRKQTNAPNKFMGSGMLPPGAYVTLEHEHILILRKGAKREFATPEEKRNRQESAFFWEERNQWFSDVWMDLKGTTQRLIDNDARQRSAAYPFELPYRLINMFSVKGDLVLDPFLGTGATMAAAIAAGRDSVGFELSSEFLTVIHNRIDTIVQFANERIKERLAAHVEFVKERVRTNGPLKHRNEYYGFPVVTSQEARLIINALQKAEKINDTTISIDYGKNPQPDFILKWEEPPETGAGPGRPSGKKKAVPEKPSQQQLFGF